jgi:integrase
VRVIDDKGEQLGIMPTHEAMARADELGLQLVEVNPKTVPPVCKIMDYGKFKYETAKRAEWAPRTMQAQAFRAGIFMDWATPSLAADRVTLDTLDQFREDLRKQGRKVTEIQRTIREVVAWFSYSAARGWIPSNPLAAFANRIARHEKPEPIDEFAPDEFARIFAALDYRDSRLWRPWVAVVLGGVLGPRQNALRHLTWDDVDLNAMTVTWRREFDKMARERVQPIPRGARFALRVAKVWAHRLPATQRSNLVLPAVMHGRPNTPYTYSALNQALRLACARAGVPWKKGRAMHGLRRHAARTMLDLTGNIKIAGEHIGDTDLKTLSGSYLRDRPEALTAAVKLITLDPKTSRNKRPNDNRPTPTGTPHA